jgi:hypothetical protein
MSLSVIGAGVGRTGTHTLKLALEQLGFGPCYHMREVLARLGTDVPVWVRAAEGKPVDWDELFVSYRSAVDFTLREWAYAQAYPNSDRRAEELLIWLHRYNWHRPHGSLQSKPPISRLALTRDNLLRLHI